MLTLYLPYISPISPLYLPGQVRDEQRESFNMLWQRACAPSGAARRRKLPDRCDQAWFVRSFCSAQGGCAPEAGEP